MIGSDLHTAISDLARIDRAGFLGDLERELAALPRDDRHLADPYWRADLDRLARAANRILGVPVAECRDAAHDAFAPSRQQQALNLIAIYIADLDQQDQATDTTAKLARERTRRTA